MENYERALEATETATHSSGSAMQENERYMDSYEAKIIGVKNAWTEATISMQEDFLGDSILGFTEVATKGIGILTTIIDKVGLLPPIFGAAGIALSALNNKFKIITEEKLLGMFTNLTNRVGTTRAAIYQLSDAYQAGGISAVKMSAQTGALNTVLVGLRSTMMSLLPMLAMTGIGFGVSKLFGYYMDAKQKAEELTKEVENYNEANMEALTKNKEQTESLLDSYKNLSENRPTGGFGDTEQEQEYLNVTNELAEVFPALVESTDSLGNARLRSADAIDGEIDGMKEMIRLEKEKRTFEAIGDFQDDLDSMDEISKEIEKINGEMLSAEDYKWYHMIPGGTTSREVSNLWKDMFGLSDEDEADLRQSEAEMNHLFANARQRMLQNIDDLQFGMEEKTPQITELINEVVSSLKLEELDDISPEKLNGITTSLNAFTNNLEAMIQSGDEQGFNQVIDALKEFLSEDFDISNIDNLLPSYDDMVKSMESGELLSILSAQAHGENEEAMGDETVAADGLVDSTKAMVESYGDAIENIEGLNSILNELDSDEGLSTDSINTMLENYPELLAYMDDEIALRDAISDKVEEQSQIALEAVAEQMLANENLYQNAIDTGNKRLQGLADQYNLDLDNFTSLAQAKQAIERQLLESLGKMWGRYLGETAKSASEMANLIDGSTGVINEQGREVFKSLSDDPEAQQQMGFSLASHKKNVDSMKKDLYAIADIDFDVGSIGIDDIGSSIKNAGRDTDKAGDSAKKAGDKSKKASEKAQKGTEDTAKEFKLSKYVADEYANSLEKVNFQLERQEAQTKKFPTHSKEYRDSLKKEISLLKEKSGVLNTQAKDLEKQIKSGNLKDYGVVDAGSLWEYTPGTAGSISGGGGSSGSVASYYLDNFRVTSGFGGRNSPGGIGSTNHKGTDFANGRAGDPVKALASGKVIHAAYTGSGGNMVTIQQDDGLVSKYMHMQNGLKVKKGQQVSAGTVLGGVGTTGNSTGNHIHLQLERNGTPFDPLPYLKQIKSGKSSGGSTSTGVPGRYSGKYAKEINASASKHGLDPNLIAAIIKQESNFNNNVTSHAGAQGLMQLMPGTARSLGVKNPFNAKQNIEGGTKYIAQQLKAFDGNLDMALAAYNAGPGNVKKHGGIPPFKETQNYVKKVSADYKKRGGNASSAQLQADASKDAANQAQALDQARSDLLGMQGEMAQIGDQVEELYFSIVESHLEQFDHERSKLDKKLAEIDYRQTWHDEESNAWAKQQLVREKTLAKQNKIHRDSIKWLEKEIKTNKNLTKGQKMRLDDMLLERQQEMWNLEKTILDERVNMAQKLIDVYKKSLQAHKDAALKSVDEIIKEIDEKEKERDYKRRLDKEQKSRQDILDEISELSIDNSDKARKRIKELTEDLQDIDESIDDMQHDKKIDDRKEALEEEKENINERYDNLIEDEKK